MAPSPLIMSRNSTACRQRLPIGYPLRHGTDPGPYVPDRPLFVPRHSQCQSCDGADGFGSGAIDGSSHGCRLGSRADGGRWTGNRWDRKRKLSSHDGTVSQATIRVIANRMGGFSL